MAQQPAFLETYCSANEMAYAASQPGSRFAVAVEALRRAIALVNTKPGPGQPNARKRGLLLDAAILSKEDAYWGVQQAIGAMPAAA